jgi:hypothetical protein
MIRTRVSKQIGAYQAKTSSTAPPDCWLDDDEARRLVLSGHARKINHGKAIRLFRTVIAGSGECGPIADAIRRLFESKVAANG